MLDQGKPIPLCFAPKDTMMRKFTPSPGRARLVIAGKPLALLFECNENTHAPCRVDIDHRADGARPGK